MFPGLFNQDNPWYSSWRTSSEVEDAQTIPTDTLFDDDEMSSDPGDHTNGATIPTHSQWDLSLFTHTQLDTAVSINSQRDPSPFSHTQPDATTSITPFEPSRPSKISSRKRVEQVSSMEADPDSCTDPGTPTEGSICTSSNNVITCLLWCLGRIITNTQQVLPRRS